VKLLLDTHIWLWSLLTPEKLTDEVARALESPENELWISPVTIWELLILVEKGRVTLDREPLQWIEAALEAVPMNEAPLTIDVAIQSRLVDLPHQDPADRFLAATAKVYGLTFVTADDNILSSKTFSLFPSR
jgi:PIN domain nuclease of toxin-antitoxin system